MTRLALLIVLAVGTGGCESKIGTPFAVGASPELRERFLSECGERQDHYGKPDPDDAPNVRLAVGSTGAKGSVSLYFDADTNAITTVYITASDYRWFLAFVHDVVLPMLKPTQRRYVAERILKDGRVDTDFTRESRAEGRIYYSRAPGWSTNVDITLSISIHGR